MAAKREFNVGDIVELKSGGPRMTVKSLPTEAGSQYTCQWFAGKKLEQGHFPEDSIQAVKTS